MFTGVDWEMIIADASDTPINQVGMPSVIHVIRESPPLGFSAGVNVACQQACGKWTMIVNDDCEMLEGYAKAAVDFMEQNPQIGLGAIAYSNRGGPFMTNAYYGMTYGNFPILSTELGNKIGWHDSEIRFYGADNSLTFRVLMAGFGVAEVPGAQILHHEHEDIHRIENTEYQQRIRDAELLAAKYGPHMDEMKATYARLGCEANSLNDQTPGWLEDKIKA